MASQTLQELLSDLQSSLVRSDANDGEPDYRSEEIERVWARSGVPGRYRQVPAAKRPVGWAYISGPVGSGKTYGACSLMRRYLEDHTRPLAGPLYRAPKCFFTTTSRYLEAVKDRFRDPSNTRAQILAEADLLVLDDLGQEVPTAWAVEQLFSLVNDRYNEDLPLIVTSQFGIDRIASRLSENGGREQAEAIASRLMGSCAFYRLEGEDRRIHATN